MARLFANLDKLKDAPRPAIVPVNQDIQQGATTVNTNFTNKISLANRLNQSSLGTTKHLPEYFLSDLQVGIINIKKFGVYEHTSDVKITYTKNPINQGGISPTIITFNPTQGSTTIVPVTADYLLRQGTALENGRYVSLIKLTKPTSVGSVIQGFATITLPSQNINQGPGTNIIYSIDTRAIGIRQGLIWNGLQFQSVITIKNPVQIDPLIPSQIKIDYGYYIKAFIRLDGTIGNQSTYEAELVRQFDENIRDKTQAIKVLRYTADRSVAFFTPQIKHGSERPQNKGLDGVAMASFKPSNNGRSATGQDSADVINALAANTPNEDRIAGLNPTAEYITVGAGRGSTLINYGGYNKPEPNKGVNTPQSLAQVLSGDDVSTKLDSASNLIQVPTLKANEKPIGFNPKNGELTGAVRLFRDVNTYDELTRLATDRNNKSVIDDETITPTNLKNKEVLLTISKVDGSRSVSFTAFMTAINDTVSAGYGDFNYIGKQDTFKLYKGTTRQLSLGFRAVALGKNETKFRNSATTARELATKVNRLIQIGVVGTVEAGKPYTTGPFVEFSLTGLYTKLKGVIGSVKVDISTTDVPWDVDDSLPMYYDITLDITVLSTKEGNLFNSNQTFIG